MAVFLAVYAREFISVLYTKTYIEGAHVFQLFLAIALFRIVNHGVILTSVGQTRIVLWGTLGFLVVNLGLGLWWVRPLGMIGPPLATLVGTLLLTAFYVARSARYLDRRWSALVPGAMLLRSILVSGAAGLGAWGVRWFHLGDLWTLLLGGVIFAGLYLAIGIPSRWIRQGDLDLVRRWLTLRPVRSRKSRP
jgi:O-antigen/teichoic acid export membrane protein